MFFLASMKEKEAHLVDRAGCHLQTEMYLLIRLHKIDNLRNDILVISIKHVHVLHVTIRKRLKRVETHPLKSANSCHEMSVWHRIFFYIYFFS